MLVGRTPEELEAIKQKYATKGHVMEAERLIAAKARNMLRHYVENILPNGFKAQVVAVSRRATIRYHDALLAARDELVAALARSAPDTCSTWTTTRSIGWPPRRRSWCVPTASCRPSRHWSSPR